MIEDITPEGSVAPVYLIPLTDEEVAELEAHNESMIADAAAQEAIKKAAADKLAALGLTIDELKVLGFGS
jgi:hypothetical protein